MKGPRHCSDKSCDNARRELENFARQDMEYKRTVEHIRQLLRSRERRRGSSEYRILPVLTREA